MKSTLQLLLLWLMGCFVCSGCDTKLEQLKDFPQSDKLVVKTIGSDVMVNLAQAWAESYQAVESDVSIEVSGGGSGIGIAALLDGMSDIATSSRELEPREVAGAATKFGKPLVKHTVAYEALAIFVHPSNPIEEISVEQLREIYAEGGTINNWSQLGIAMPHGQDQIFPTLRQGTMGMLYFRAAVVGRKGDFKQGSHDFNGSMETVRWIANEPGAIGFAPPAYKTDQIKMLKVSSKTGEPAFAPPAIETIEDMAYPLCRPMLMFTTLHASANVRKYIAWILSAPGQNTAYEHGFIPLRGFAPVRRK